MIFFKFKGKVVILFNSFKYFNNINILMDGWYKLENLEWKIEQI